MKKDELEIEKLAQEYFRDDSRSRDLENKLLNAIYANKEFVVRIVSKAAGKYENVISDLNQLKHDAVLRTLKTAKEKYNSKKGSFINYFSRNLMLYTLEILKTQYKKEQQLTLDEPVSSAEGASVTMVEIQESEFSTVKETEESIYEEKFLQILLNSLNRLCFSTKAGRKNKSKVYTYFVLECLLSKSEDLFNKYINKYDFLKMQKEALLEIRQDYLHSREIPNQKEYAKITGMPEGKFSEFTPQMEAYLYNAPELQDYKN